jgi:hypothetical protein
LVEQRPYKARVGGSSPSAPTTDDCNEIKHLLARCFFFVMGSRQGLLGVGDLLVKGS